MMTKKSKQHKYMGRKSMLIRNLPDNLKDHFKARCLIRGHSMVYVLTRLMHDYIKGEIDITPPPPRKK